MKVKFGVGYDEKKYFLRVMEKEILDKFLLLSNFADVLSVNDWALTDIYNIEYDELNGKKRIIITKEKDESK